MCGSLPAFIGGVSVAPAPADGSVVTSGVGGVNGRLATRASLPSSVAVVFPADLSRDGLLLRLRFFFAFVVFAVFAKVKKAERRSYRRGKHKSLETTSDTAQ